jgi:leucyl aminopeptidase
MNIHYTKSIKKRNIDTYIINIDKKNIDKSMNKIVLSIDIPNIPKLFYKRLFKEGEKSIYTDNYELLFLHTNDIYKTYGKCGKKLSDVHSSNDSSKNIFIFLVNNEKDIREQIVGFILGYYEFTAYHSEKSAKHDANIYFYHSNPRFKNIITESINLAKVQNEIRDLINMPANDLNSITYEKYIKKNLPDKVKMKVLDERALKKLGCNLILGVNAGSKYPAKMIILEYGHGKNPIALVGKGVMFDSGGLDVKHGDFSDMKTDMTGSAIVYGVIKLLAECNKPGHFIGLLPIVENMVDANSIRPGDILTAYNKSTVEVVYTDAEGRLIMADALAYSSKYSPRLCIDVATLTGGVSTTFGDKASVIMGNNNKLIQQMIQLGDKNHEKLWELPMWKEYIDLTKSKIADYRNYSVEAKASTIMGGAFLSNFVPSKTDWIHLDIASRDFLKSNTENRHSGATAEILRTLFYFLLL